MHWQLRGAAEWGCLMVVDSATLDSLRINYTAAHGDATFNILIFSSEVIVAFVQDLKYSKYNMAAG